MTVLEAATLDDREIEPDSFMALARSESRNSTMSHKLGSVLVKNKKVIGRGYNVRKTHPDFGAGKFQMIHSEGAAIYDAVKKGYNPEGSTMYIYRKNANLAKPCPHCEAIIKKYKINKVIYTS